jgi:hypothetical protein
MMRPTRPLMVVVFSLGVVDADVIICGSFPEVGKQYEE